jgi:hypothetical protein
VTTKLRYLDHVLLLLQAHISHSLHEQNLMKFYITNTFQNDNVGLKYNQICHWMTFLKVEK